MADCISGRLAWIKLSSDGGNTWKRLGKAVDLNLSTTTSELECTSKDDNGIAKYHPNILEATVQGSARYSEADVGQNIVVTAAFLKSTFRAQFAMMTGAGARVFEAECFSTSLDMDAPLSDIAMLNFTLRMSDIQPGFQPG